MAGWLARAFRWPMCQHRRQRFTLHFMFFLGSIMLLLVTPFTEGQVATCVMFVGVRSRANPMAQFGGVTSSSDCSAKCLANPRCGSFSWMMSLQQCNLLGSTDPFNTFMDQDAISGFKTAETLTSPASVNFPELGTATAIRLQGSAVYSEPAVALTYEANQAGLAMLLSPVQLLRDVNSRCEAASFSVAFSFQNVYSPVDSPAAGFTFFLVSSDTPTDGLATLVLPNDGRYQGFSLSSADVLRRPGAMAIEYDTFKDTASNDPDDSHVGLNVNYDPRSLIAASTLPSSIELKDIRMKYSWIDYNASNGVLTVYLSYNETKPQTPLLSYPLNLCQTLRPPTCSSCSTATNAFIGFSGATAKRLFQLSYIYSWSFESSWPASQPATPPPSSQCTIMENCRFDDFDLEKLQDVSSPSASDCCSRCAEEPRCGAFNWLPTNRCQLKTAGDILVQGDPKLAGQFCGEKARVLTTVPASITFPTFSASSGMHLLGSAAVVGTTLKLTSAANQAGLALYPQPVQLLRDIESQCQAASFSAAFSFLIYDRSRFGFGEGFTFMALASNLLFGQLGVTKGAPTSHMGFHYKTKRPILPGSLAVEFDTARTNNLGPLELAAGHVGIDMHYSPKSLAAVPTSAAGINLTDSLIKYAWVDYDAEFNTLSIYLGYSAIKPKAPVLTYEIDMCKVLRPPDCLRECASVTTGYVGFSAATTSKFFQQTEVHGFQFRSFWPSDARDTGNIKLGLVPSARAPQKLNQFFRFASMGYLSQTGVNGRPPSWLVATRWNWTVDAVGPIRDQKSCGACYAFAAASAMESASYLTTYNRKRSVPDMAEQQLVDCMGDGQCQGGWPADALDFAASKAIVFEKAYPYKSANGTCRVPAESAVVYQPTSLEAVNFLNWFGLLLAVQQTPVVVNIEGSSPSFVNYDGGIYDDGNCYSRGVDHSVVIVGYDIVNSPPYWILRNSWGTQWGERGYMRMAIKSGDGICGINTMPGYIPIFKARDGCNTNSYPKQTGLFNVDAAPGRLNPCGGGKCTNLAGGKNKCACPKDFVAANNTDGSQTCVPVSPCTFLTDSPCRVGTCLDSETKPGTYSCICPLGYEEGTLAADNSTTCVPAALVGGLQIYTVPADFSVTCARIYEVYGISKATFLAQNKGLLDCSKPLLPGTMVNVTNDLLNGCALPYAVNTGDTCTSIAKLFNIRALNGPDSPNPDLNCDDLQPGQQVCIIRRSADDTSPPDMPMCTGFYTVSSSETCPSVIASVFGGDAGLFFTLNPGLYCNNFNRLTVANNGLSVTLGQRVCTAATNLEAVQRGCTGKLISVQSGDTCLSLITEHYCRRRRVFQQFNNNWNCDNSRLLTGSNSRLRLCAPKSCAAYNLRPPRTVPLYR